MKNKQIIGVSGVARVGKNLFCDIASDILLKDCGLTSKTHALAYYLKKDCESFVKEKLGLSVWSEDTEEKKIFRPLLIYYGSVKREQTNGRYWIEMLEPDIKECDADVSFISDIRFASHKNDEVHWLKGELNGSLIHLSKFAYKDGVKEYTPPASDDERVNEPHLKRSCDVDVEWEHTSQDLISARNNKELIGIVRDALYKIDF